MHINESGDDGLTPGIDHPSIAFHTADAADLDDGSLADSDVGRATGGSRTVIDRAAHDDNITDSGTASDKTAHGKKGYPHAYAK
jgi:hypothetical protein